MTSPTRVWKASSQVHSCFCGSLLPSGQTRLLNMTCKYLSCLAPAHAFLCPPLLFSFRSMCVHVCMQIYVCLCACVCVGWSSILGIFLICSPSHILRQALSESRAVWFGWSSWLVCSSDPCLSLQHWTYWWTITLALHLCGCWSYELWSLRLHRKFFVHWAIFPTPCPFVLIHFIVFLCPHRPPGILEWGALLVLGAQIFFQIFCTD